MKIDEVRKMLREYGLEEQMSLVNPWGYLGNLDEELSEYIFHYNTQRCVVFNEKKQTIQVVTQYSAYPHGGWYKTEAKINLYPVGFATYDLDSDSLDEIKEAIQYAVESYETARKKVVKMKIKRILKEDLED